MPSISVKTQTKEEWDEMKPDDMTHDEFAQHAIDCIRRDNGEIVDVESIVEDVTKHTAASVELAAYRGTQEAIKDTLDDGDV